MINKTLVPEIELWFHKNKAGSEWHHSLMGGASILAIGNTSFHASLYFDKARGTRSFKQHWI